MVLRFTAKFLGREEKHYFLAAGGALLYHLWSKWWNLGVFSFIEITLGDMTSFWGAYSQAKLKASRDRLLHVCCHWWPRCLPAPPTLTRALPAMVDLDPHPASRGVSGGLHLQKGAQGPASPGVLGHTEVRACATGSYMPAAPTSPSNGREQHQNSAS